MARPALEVADIFRDHGAAWRDANRGHVSLAQLKATRTEGRETVIAEGRYITDDAPRPRRSAEVAFTTEEDYQGRGIARLLLRHLVRIARENSVSRLEADVLAGNQPMLTVFHRSGLPMQQRSDGGVIHVTLSLVEEDSGEPSQSGSLPENTHSSPIAPSKPWALSQKPVGEKSLVQPRERGAEDIARCMHEKAPKDTEP